MAANIVLNMKKLLTILAVAVAALCISSCQPVVSGDFLYTITPEASTGSCMSWQMDSLGEDLILKEVQSAGGVQLSSAWKFSGLQTDCDKKVKDIVNSAMNKAEADPKYCSFFDFSDVTVVVTRIGGAEEGNTVIFQRKYKAKK